MIISIIAAVGNQLQLGKNGNLPWHIPEELAHFKSCTLGHSLLMGRKTFESLPSPLANRDTIVVSRDKNYKSTMCLVVNTIEDGIEQARSKGESEIFICGGAEIYRETLPLADRVYLSRVDWEGDADTFFPQFDHSIYQEVDTRAHPATSKSPAWSFHLYQSH